MKVALVGAGHIAAVHVMAIRRHPGAEIVGVADRFKDYADVFAEEHAIPKTFGDITEMIEATRPHVVHVLTPPATHRDAVLECLDGGCHVLVEKPMTVTSDEAQQLIEAAEGQEKWLSVNHNCRFEPTVSRALRLIESGGIGEVVTVEVDFGFDINRYPAILQEGATESHWCYQLNGGPLQDQMPHPLSMVVGFLGEVLEVKAISSSRGKVPSPWNDEIRVAIQGERAHAEVYCSFSHRPDAMIFTVRGTKGTVIADMHAMICTADKVRPLPRGVVRLEMGFTRSWHQLAGAVANVFRVGAGRLDTTNGVAGLVEGFYNAIREDRAPPVTMQEGKQVVELIQRIWPEPLRERRADAVASTAALATRRKPPSILVTGATGFVGSHLLSRLIERGESVRALARPSSPGIGLLRRSGADVFIGDLANEEAVRDAMEGIEYVYHIGGAMGGGWGVHQAATVRGTENVLKAALETEPRRIVYYSSLAVYDVLAYRNGALITEDSVLHEDPEPYGPYSRGKIAAEQLIRRVQAQGVPTTIIRPGIIIGPRGPLFFPHLGFKLQDRVFIMLRSGRLHLPLVDVGNLVDGTIAAVHCDAAVGKVYNLVDDGEVDVVTYLERFRERTGIPSRIVNFPFALPYLAAATYEALAALRLLKKGSTSRRQLRWKHKPIVFSNAAAKRDFGYQTKLPIEQAMDRTFDWYVSQRK